MRNCVWVGLDIGADESRLCVTDGSGVVLAEALLPTNAGTVIDFINEVAPDTLARIAVESGTFSIPLTRSLRQQGYAVTILEAFQASRFLQIRRNKTDRNDAKGLADVLRLGGIPVRPVHLKALDKQMLRSRLVIRHQLIGQRVALDNLMRSTFRLYGGHCQHWWSASGLQRSVMSEIDRLKEVGIDLSQQVLPLMKLSVALRAYDHESKRDLKVIADSVEICQRWMEIPGVGPLTCLSLYTAIDDPDRFSKADDIGAYLGLVPRIAQSSTKSRRGHISKRGDVMARTQLVAAARVAMRDAVADTALKRWALKVRERRGGSRARVALARKLAVVMLAMWKSNQRYKPFAENGVTG